MATGVKWYPRLAAVPCAPYGHQAAAGIVFWDSGFQDLEPGKLLLSAGQGGTRGSPGSQRLRQEELHASDLAQLRLKMETKEGLVWAGVEGE